MEEILNRILSELKEMKASIGELEVEVKETKASVGELKEGQIRLEVGLEKLQKNLVDSLGSYTEALYKFRVESDIERLNKQ